MNGDFDNTGNATLKQRQGFVPPHLIPGPMGKQSDDGKRAGRDVREMQPGMNGGSVKPQPTVPRPWVD